MRAIYECPYCGEQNMVPEDRFGKHYTCYNCGNDFAIVRYADCPSCGETNLLEEPADDMTYVCHKCGQEFEYVEGGSRPKPGLPKRGSFGPKRRQVEYIKPKTYADSAPYVPPAEDYGLAAPIVALFKLFSYEGRARRWEFNGLLLMMTPFCIASGIIEKHGSDSDVPTIIYCIIAYLTICAFACGVRRANDSVQSAIIRSLFLAFAISTFLFITIPIAILVFLYMVFLLATSPSKD